jgi:BirA family transcriptional regulator, biotin operon repressor / biotin---[acetyl-CoA-carboxylase] ligase
MTIPADIAPGVFEVRLRSRLIGRRLTVLEEVGSTNDVAMAAGHAGHVEGMAILADRQVRGRGRSGRTWASLSGLGVYTSILLRPTVPPQQALLLTLLAGLATADAIRAVCTLEARLKWPNDVLLDGRKVAGILTEMTTVGQTVSHVVVGIGINVHHRLTDFPDDVRMTATSIGASAGRRVERAEVAAALYHALDRWYAAFCAGERDRILTEARARTATLGRGVTVVAGPDRWRGRALDLDVDGALLVQDHAGTVHRVLAADVSIREEGSL